MNPDAIRAYVTKWKLAGEKERDELRAMTAARKFEQLAALVQSVIALDWQTSDPQEIEIVRERWNRLRSLYRE